MIVFLSDFQQAHFPQVEHEEKKCVKHLIKKTNHLLFVDFASDSRESKGCIKQVFLGLKKVVMFKDFTLLLFLNVNVNKNIDVNFYLNFVHFPRFPRAFSLHHSMIAHFCR